MSLRADTFEDDLNRRLGGGYRLRWSPYRQTWQIEQKVSRATDVPKGSDDYDRWQRARDGYALVIEVSPQPVMRCQYCRSSLQVPVLKVGEVRCSTCHASKSRGTVIYYVGYFPLSDRLLNHLESTSPKMGYGWIKQMHYANLAEKLRREAAFGAALEYGIADHRNVIAGNPVIGYGNTSASTGRAL